MSETRCAGDALVTRDHARGAPAPTRARREHLAEQVAGELSAAWERGERPRTEDYLARYPELRDHPEAAARVIYEEICVREGLGQRPDTAELSGRFPHWRDELRMLRQCHELLRPGPPPPSFPEVGSTLGDYRLHAVLGRGQRGRVFLATQQTLADRPVVLKVTRLAGGEHLSLARLQHPNVVPLYAAHDFPGLGLRALCLPYLGGLTLDRAIGLLADRPPGDRRGADLVRILDEARTEPNLLPAWSGSRQFFAGAAYPRAVCWVGACLAEALHAAHTRGLLHLDLKPSNVLLADDGQPMLLDFHLARGPLGPGDPPPNRIGGTEGYMSPEQGLAMDALRRGLPVPAAVDERSDVYSLGVTLYELLAGSPPPGAGASAADLVRSNPRVGWGLAGIVAKCLAPEPTDRYPGAAALAADLRRHLGYLPLQGVPRRARFARWLAAWRAFRDHG